jgi:hypothetical protein
MWDKGREVDGVQWENTVDFMENLGWDGINSRGRWNALGCNRMREG